MIYNTSDFISKEEADAAKLNVFYWNTRKSTMSEFEKERLARYKCIQDTKNARLLAENRRLTQLSQTPMHKTWTHQQEQQQSNNKAGLDNV
jgi:hypothetical protein